MSYLINRGLCCRKTTLRMRRATCWGARELPCSSHTTRSTTQILKLSIFSCTSSVADPDPGSRAFFDPWIWIQDKFFPDLGSNPYFLIALSHFSGF
jgi:hypothetical protein